MIQKEANFEDTVDWAAQYSAARRALSEIASGHVEQVMKSALLEGELEKAQKTIGKIAGDNREKDTDLKGVTGERDEYFHDLVHLSKLLTDSSVVRWGDSGGSQDAIEIVNKYRFIELDDLMEDEPEDGWSGENDAQAD